MVRGRGTVPLCHDLGVGTSFLDELFNSHRLSYLQAYHGVQDDHGSVVLCIVLGIGGVAVGVAHHRDHRLAKVLGRNREDLQKFITIKVGPKIFAIYI